MLVHLLLGTYLLTRPVSPPLLPLSEDHVNVEIVASSDVPVFNRREQAPVSNDVPQSLDAGERTKDDDATVEELAQSSNAAKAVVPTKMLSEQVLADARSGDSREELLKLAPADQVDQLCGLEAMAQVAAWNSEIQPEKVISYVIEDPVLDGDVFTAEGAALQSKSNWYRIRFKCTLDPDHGSVVAFEFVFGALISREDWPKYMLHDENEVH